MKSPLGIVILMAALFSVSSSAFAKDDSTELIFKPQTIKIEYSENYADTFRVQVPYIKKEDHKSVPLLGAGAVGIREYAISPSRRFVYINKATFLHDSSVTPYVYDTETQEVHRVCEDSPDCGSFAEISGRATVNLYWLPNDLLSAEFDYSYATTSTAENFISASSAAPWIMKASTDTPLTDDIQKFRSNTLNIQMHLPDGWTVDEKNSTEVPKGHDDPLLILRKSGSSCVIAAAEPNSQDLGTQTSFGDSMYSPYWQFSSSWFVNKRGPDFSHLGRQYLPGEYRNAISSRSPSMLLYTDRHVAVPDDCNADFNTLLRTVEPYYESATLTATSSGMLTSDKVWDDVPPWETDGSFEHIVFAPEGGVDHHQLARLPENSYLQTFFVDNGKIYFFANVPRFSSDVENQSPDYDSVIYEFDAFTKALTEIPNSFGQNTYISSIYVHDSTVYFLRGGPEAFDCYGGCPTSVYSMPLNGEHEPQQITGTEDSMEILGYDAAKDRLYIYSGWGDAGCSRSKIRIIEKGEEREVVSSSSCYDEKLSRSDHRKKVTAEKLIAKAQEFRIRAPGVRVEDGALKPLVSERDVHGWFSFEKR
jgi:hypothetical protein